MEPVDDSVHAFGRAADTAAVAEQLDAVMAGPAHAPIDLDAYLLNPPPTSAQVERMERRRRMVRGGSIAAACVLGVVTLLPMPRFGAAETAGEPAGAATVAMPAVVAPAPDAAAERLAESAVRVDRQPARTPARPVRSTRKKHRAPVRMQAPARRAASASAAHAPTTQRPSAQAPAPAPAPASTGQPSPAAANGGEVALVESGALVPVL